MEEIKTELYYTEYIKATVTFVCFCGAMILMDEHVDIDGEIPDFDERKVKCEKCNNTYTYKQQTGDDDGEEIHSFIAKLNS